MRRINPDLLKRLAAKLQVSEKQVYAKIGKVAARTLLPRHLAALVLAAENKISFQRYASEEDLQQIRASSSGGGGKETSNEGGFATISSGAQSKHPRIKQGRKSPRTKDNSVFVVHGRDEGLRKSMFDFLRSLSLKPMEWSKAVLLAPKGGANPQIEHIIDGAMARVQAVVVMFSPDDLASLRPCLQSKGEGTTEGKVQGQPRPNVLFEAGLALGRHPEKTLLVQIGSIRSFSDIGGKHVVRLTNDTGKRLDVANRLRKIGCDVDLNGTDWTTAGDFTPKPDLTSKRRDARKSPST